MYAIAKLINGIINNDKDKKRRIVQALGYRNMAKGFRRLHQLMHGDFSNNELISRLPGALNVDPSIVEEAILLTEREIQAKREKLERENFRPYLYIQHEQSRPNQIFVVAFTGIAQWKHIYLPSDITSWSWIDQILHVRGEITDHLLKTDGGHSIFGKVTGFVYRKNYDRSISFSIAGEVLDDNLEKPPEPKAWFKVS